MVDGPAFESRSKSERCRHVITDETGWKYIELVPGSGLPVITNVPEA